MKGQNIKGNLSLSNVKMLCNSIYIVSNQFFDDGKSDVYKIAEIHKCQK